jgi:hypothetical protein
MRSVKQVPYNIYIHYEGEVTEPNFFKLLLENIINGSQKLNDLEDKIVKVTVFPEPKEEPEFISEPNKHKAKRNQRGIKGVKEEAIALPLKYIVACKEKLVEGSADEAWAIFDHDNHPARQEAFTLASENTEVNIAFSSMAFEYYLLLHFEYINYPFSTSECRENIMGKSNLLQCGTGRHSNDCFGKKCIGGSARSKEYWTNSKSNGENMFALIQQRLEFGFINCARLRYESDLQNSTIPIYDRNPYLTTDAIVKRLLNNIEEYIWIDVYKNDIISKLSISYSDHQLFITNVSNIVKIIPENQLFYLHNNQNIYSLQQIKSNRLILMPNQSECIAQNLSSNIHILQIDNNRICFQII